VERDSDEPDTPSPRVKYIGRLNTVEGIRREICRLYCESRRGELDVGAASKLANILFIAGRLLEGAELEARLRTLEAKTAAEPWRK
jgi:hypothetical protein